MTLAPHDSLASQDRLGDLESVLGFWAEVGVDTAFEDAPVNRLVAPPPKTPPPRARPPAASLSVAPAPAGTPQPDLAAAVTEARALASAAPDLAALEVAIAAFDGCPLKMMGATRAVFSRGSPGAPVMIIGEGPGADEDREGAPFVGRAGKLLDLMIEAAGLTGRVFITNTVFWRPPGNRTPTLAEQATCLPFVERAIALVAPRVLVLAGGASAKAMLRTQEGILSLRGHWSDWTPEGEGGGTPLPALPTLHPAFLLRQPLAKKKAWVDLLSLRARLESLGVEL